MVLGTDSGELLIIEGTELKATLQLDPGSTVLSIAAYSKVVPLLCFQPIARCALAEVFHSGTVFAWAYLFISYLHAFVPGVPACRIISRRLDPPFHVMNKTVTNFVTCISLHACD